MAFDRPWDRFGAFWSLLLGVVVAVALHGTALAEKRVALVIGVSAYQHVSKLPNPTRDADAVAALLRTSGFDVVESRRDVGIAELRRAVGDFSETARDADIAVVFFAGHGIEVDGTNYLVPADARLARDFDVEDEALSLDRLLRAVEPAKRLRFVMLDACRDNPFAKTMKRSVASRSVGRGLAKVEPTVADTLIAFAAKAGAVALDGDGANSPFTSGLIKHIATPGLDLRIAFGHVRDHVMAEEPYISGSLGGRLVSIAPSAADAPALAGTTAAPNQQRATAAPAPVAAPSEAAEAWRTTKDTTSQAVLETFVRRFGDTVYGEMARARLNEMKVAAATHETPAARPATPAPVTPQIAAATPAATPAPVATGPRNYLGCFKDTGKRDLGGLQKYDRLMTTDMCLSICKQAGFSYAGTQYASYCFCGNSFGSAGAATNCDAKCTGNRDETCGGTWANSIYKLN